MIGDRRMHEWMDEHINGWNGIGSLPVLLNSKYLIWSLFTSKVFKLYYYLYYLYNYNILFIYTYTLKYAVCYVVSFNMAM